MLGARLWGIWLKTGSLKIDKALPSVTPPPPTWPSYTTSTAILFSLSLPLPISSPLIQSPFYLFLPCLSLSLSPTCECEKGSPGASNKK